MADGNLVGKNVREILVKGRIAKQSSCDPIKEQAREKDGGEMKVKPKEIEEARKS